MIASVVALLPMRHDSERVPGKNYRDFDGVPLFHHILQTVLAVPEVRLVVIDTDSDIIAVQCAEHFPSVMCIRRPGALTGGDVPMTAVLQHDASVVESDWYLQTHSTNPLLTAPTLRAAIRQLSEALDVNDSLFSVNRLQTRLYDAACRPINHDPTRLERTQDLPPVFEENSNIYLFSADHIREGRRIGDRPLLFEMDRLESIDIDEESDFVLAEALHRYRQGRG